MSLVIVIHLAAEPVKPRQKCSRCERLLIDDTYFGRFVVTPFPAGCLVAENGGVFWRVQSMPDRHSLRCTEPAAQEHM